MSVQELLPMLRQLDRGDKLRVMQFLIGELSREEGILLGSGAEYPIWSPYAAFEAADSLLNALKTDRTADDAER
jgi:hypothetical protein